MAFPTGWNRRCPLVIQHGQVTADQTGLPVLITNASGCLPPEMVTTGDPNAAQSDGGDIRFTSDLAGTTQLACEIVAWTQNATAASAIAEIWVPVNVLTASDVTIYVWYNAGGGQSQPAAGAAFGSQAVWDSNYTAVFHLQTIGARPSGTTPDSTANGNTLQNDGSSNSTTAAGAFTGGGNAGFFIGDNSWLRRPSTGLGSAVGNPTGSTTFTLEGWFQRTTGHTSGQEFFGFGGNTATGRRTAAYWQNDGNIYDEMRSFTDPRFAWTADTNWHQAIWTFPSGTSQAGVLGYFDGVSQTITGAGTDTVDNENPGGIIISGIPGAAGNNGAFGSVDEVRISKIARSASWIATEYNNMNAPASFIIAGTPTNTGGGGTLLANPLYGGFNPLQGFLS